MREAGVDAARTSLRELHERRVDGLPYFELSSQVYGIALGSAHTEMEQELSAVPSLTRPRERLLLYNLLRSIWSGRGHAVEMGALLGGTTRAIALGMMSNPNRDPQARLFTYDRFGATYDPDWLFNLADPLFQQGTLSEATRRRITQAADKPDLLEVFLEVHGAEAYFPLLRVTKATLPDRRDETASPNNDLLTVDSTLDYEVVFIDGCKSWFATKYFMMQLGPCTRPGACFVFQDFEYFKTYWIPVFLMIFRSHFQRLANVENTHVFRLVQPLSGSEIEELFPDTPDTLGAGQLDAAFRVLVEEASARNDARGVVHHTLQHVAALTKLAQPSRASAVLESIRHIPWSAQLSDKLNQARSNLQRHGLSLTLDDP
jgi:hypothetical protein